MMANITAFTINNAAIMIEGMMISAKKKEAKNNIFNYHSGQRKSNFNFTYHRAYQHLFQSFWAMLLSWLDYIWTLLCYGLVLVLLVLQIKEGREKNLLIIIYSILIPLIPVVALK